MSINDAIISTNNNDDPTMLIKITPWEDIIPTEPTSKEAMIDIVHKILLKSISSLFSARITPPGSSSSIPSVVTPDINSQLLNLISEISEHCPSSKPYHNFSHTFHVFLSAYKLLDMFIKKTTTPLVPTFGIASNPLLQLAFLFSALILDIDHPGVSNRTLIDTENPLAILYNDQSPSEQHSLAMAFQILRKKKYDDLRRGIFAEEEDYVQFRRMVIDLVLCTDTESPERIQIAKSKWKEAFGESEETKRKRDNRRKSICAMRQSLSLSSSTGGGGGVSERDFVEVGTQNVQKNSLSTIQSSGMATLETEDDNLDAEERFSIQSLALSAVSGITPLPGENTSGSSSGFTQEELRESQGGTRPFMAAFFSHRSSMPSVTAYGKKNLTSADLLQQMSIDNDDWSDDDASLSPSQSSMEEDDEDNNNNKDTTTNNADDDDNNNNVAKKQDRRRSSFPRASKLTDNNNSGTIQKQTIDKLQQEAESSSPKTLERPGQITRRFSAPLPLHNNNHHRLHLGIMRALDYTGSTIENFPSKLQRRGSVFGVVGPPKMMIVNASMMLRSHSSVSDGSASFTTGGAVAFPDTTNPQQPFSIKTTKFLTDDNDNDDTNNKPTTPPPPPPPQQQFFVEDDDPLRASAILELMMRVANVAPHMQSWNIFKKWQTLLFFEQTEAATRGRGVEDPSLTWFENQMTFLDSYVMPLATKMEDWKCFGTTTGRESGAGGGGLGQRTTLGAAEFCFVNLVESNKKRWISEGWDVVKNMILEWEETKGKTKVATK